MHVGQRNALRSFRRVKDFLASHPLSETADGLGKQAQELDAVIMRLTEVAEEQEAGFRLSRQETRRQQMLREEVREQHMRPISNVAKAVFDPSGMDRALLMPKKSADNDALIAAGRAMAQAAEARASVFLEHAFAADFVAQLRRAVTELEEAQGSKVDSKRRQVVATASVAELVRRGRRAVRLLDAIVTPRLSKDPDWYTAWQAVKRPVETATAGNPGVSLEKHEIKVA